MDYIKEIGVQALGSRLKRLSDQFNVNYADVYKGKDIVFKPNWFLLMHYLSTYHEKSVTEIAHSLHITHPSVNQITKDMLEQGILEARNDENDGRRRLLRLSNKGKDLVSEIMPIWECIWESHVEMIESTGCDILDIVEKLENELSSASLAARVEEKLRARKQLSSQ
jgi:DNA-binding MarR family transcriptional regulator